ncbi:MAG: GIY-YIG nuclease family protein [Flavobacteriales bacterium]
MSTTAFCSFFIKSGKLFCNWSMWYVYLLRCTDGKIYTGCTNNMEERLKRHKNATVRFTKSRLPVELITYVVFIDKYKAFEFEKYLKSG